MIPNPPKRPLPVFVGIVIMVFHFMLPAYWSTVLFIVGAVVLAYGAWPDIYEGEDSD